MDLKFLKRIMKFIFTWWNRQTFGTFLKNNFFLENLLEKTNLVINIIKEKKDERWVIYKEM